MNKPKSGGVVVRLLHLSLLLLLVGLASCSGADSGTPTAGAAETIGDRDSRDVEDLPAQDATDDVDETSAADSEQSSDGSLAFTDGQDTTGVGDDVVDESLDSSDSPDSPGSPNTPDTPDEASPTAQHLSRVAALLPSGNEVAASLIETGSHRSLAELIANRQSATPLVRCGAGDDPTSVAESTGGETAGRTFDYAGSDGTQTITSQLWVYPSAAEADRAMTTVANLRCSGLANGSIDIGGAIYDQVDSADAIRPPLTFPSADREEAVDFQRILTSESNQLEVREDLYLVQFDAVVHLTAYRTIFVDDQPSAQPTIDALRLHQVTADRLALDLGRSASPPPATEIAADSVSLVGLGVEPGTYRSVADAYCEVRRLSSLGDDPANEIERITWGASEQAVVTIAESDGAFISGQGCGTWKIIDLTNAETLPNPGNSGTLIVGIDVSAASVTVTSIGDCTVRELLGFSGEAADLLSETLVTPGDTLTVDLGGTAGLYVSSGCRF